jgi:protein involved in polysaccharide export with SLBB domain
MCRQFVASAAILMSLSLSGCTALLSPIDTIPADRVPQQFLAEPQADKIPIDVSRLRINKPEYYLLDEKDILGVFVEGVLGNFEEAPPVRFPEPGSDLPPAIGYPVPIRQDGTVSLPLVNPIPVRGLTIEQAEQVITRAYRQGPEPILKEDGRIIVTLMQERTYRVFVVRQDNSFSQVAGQFAGRGSRAAVTDRSDLSSRGFVLQLPAYKNDVLNALSQTGGLPGINAKTEIRILRGDRLSTLAKDREIAEFYRTANAAQFPYGIIPTIPDDANSLRIPMRLKPGENPNIRPEDIVLKDGDIVYVDTRDTDVYYTGGLLGGGEFPLPRDYDLDILAAASIAGQGLAVGGGAGNQGRFGSSVATVPPTELIVLRRVPGDQQLAIRVNINNALNNPKARILVKAGDTLILRYTPQEELINFAINTFFTYGVARLFRN